MVGGPRGSLPPQALPGLYFRPQQWCLRVGVRGGVVGVLWVRLLPPCFKFSDFKGTVLSCGATYVECRGVSLSTN